MSLDLIKTREIYLSHEKYDASLSSIRFELIPSDEEKWTQLMDIPLIIASRFQSSNIFLQNFASKNIQNVYNNLLTSI